MATTNRPNTERSILIMIPCHAIFIGNPDEPYVDPNASENWLLQAFQKETPFKESEHLTFLRHIDLAISIYNKKPSESVLVFSGGATAPPSRTTKSEAKSYLDAATTRYGKEAISNLSILCEEYATDLYQNLLFSIIRFHKELGYYPSEMEVVTHAFKAQRIRKMHRKVIRWPEARLRVHGINPKMSRTRLFSPRLFVVSRDRCDY